MKLSTSDKGRKAEQLVARYLQKKGWKILFTNYRVAGGEIDIIASDKKDIVIIEVKSGKQNSFDLTESVDFQKKKKLQRAVEQFLFQEKMQDRPVRFEIITVSMPDEKIHHFPQEFFDD